MRLSLTAAALLTASPAFAAKGPFFSLGNTDFVVMLGFITFILVLIYFKVPGMIGGLLDKRADTIKSELDEAKALREDAQALLASYERKQAEVKTQADEIVAAAKKEAMAAAQQAKLDIEKTVERRLASAHDQIASAEAAAVKEVRERAIDVAIGAAGDVVASSMDAKAANALIDKSISVVGQKLQ